MSLEIRPTWAPELVVALVLFVVPSVARGQTIYTVTDLGTLGGEASLALGISNAGHVVGWGETGSVRAARHAFIWIDGALTDLGHLGGLRSEALAVNSRGHVVAWSDSARRSIESRLLTVRMTLAPGSQPDKPLESSKLNPYYGRWEVRKQAIWQM